MLHPIQNQQTCATAWLAAARYLVALGTDAYNLVVDIDNPVSHTEADRQVICAIDQFLRARRANPIVTVANTIFPQDLYRRFGPKRFCEEYLRVFDSIKNKGWGRYFERMIRWPSEDGETVDQLEDLIARLTKQHRSRQTFHNVYEMTLFDPARDKNRNRNRQCLSFLSFKLHPQRGLMLTAMYRNHTYISRALGNFIGLGNLMAYIASRVGVPVGPLTCVSTHAQLDTASPAPDRDSNPDACHGWTLNDVRQLISEPKPLADDTTVTVGAN